MMKNQQKKQPEAAKNIQPPQKKQNTGAPQGQQ